MVSPFFFVLFLFLLLLVLVEGQMRRASGWRFSGQWWRDLWLTVL